MEFLWLSSLDFFTDIHDRNEKHTSNNIRLSIHCCSDLIEADAENRRTFPLMQGKPTLTDPWPLYDRGTLFQFLLE